MPTDCGEAEDVDEHLLRVVVERVRLARHDELQRRAVGKDPTHALRVVRQQEEALVGRDPTREAERQRVLGERLRDRHHVVGVLAAEQPVLHRLHLDVVDEKASRSLSGRFSVMVKNLLGDLVLDRLIRHGDSSRC